MEMLEEKLGPSAACFNVRSIDLSNSKLREIGALLNDETFPSLRELILDNNQLESVNTLGPLSKLLVTLSATRVRTMIHTDIPKHPSAISKHTKRSPFCAN